MLTILLFSSAPGSATALAPLLAAEGYGVVTCCEGEALVEAVVARAPAALIYALRAEIHGDLGILHLLRRIAPTLPIILLACEGSLDARRLLNDVRPIYYTVAPADEQEILAAVRGAVKRRPIRPSPSRPPAA